MEEGIYVWKKDFGILTKLQAVQVLLHDVRVIIA